MLFGTFNAAATRMKRDVSTGTSETRVPSGPAGWRGTVLRWLPYDWTWRWPPRFVSGFLLVLIALVIVQGVHDARHPPGMGLTPNIIAVGVNSAMPPPVAVSLAALVNAHLFGQQVRTASVPMMAPPDWQVVGIVVGVTPDESVADLAVNGGEHLLRIGDRLPDGSVMAVIQASSVTLERNGTPVLVHFDLQPAPLNAGFKTLPIVRSSAGQATILAARVLPRAKSPTPVPMFSQLATLRAVALRQFAARAHHAPPR